MAMRYKIVSALHENIDYSPLVPLLPLAPPHWKGARQSPQYTGPFFSHTCFVMSLGSRCVQEAPVPQRGDLLVAVECLFYLKRMLRYSEFHRTSQV